MTIYKKRYYWGYRDYNSKTGLYKGETRYSTDGTTRDWKGQVIKKESSKGFSCD